jgi:hypothetical protein
LDKALQDMCTLAERMAAACEHEGNGAGPASLTHTLAPAMATTILPDPWDSSAAAAATATAGTASKVAHHDGILLESGLHRGPLPSDTAGLLQQALERSDQRHLSLIQMQQQHMNMMMELEKTRLAERTRERRERKRHDKKKEKGRKR